MKNIAIIGAGQLGSRHLQALANCKNELSIQVVDPFFDSLNVAELRFGEVSQNFKGKISFHKSISEIEKNQDVVIVATNSKMRRAVVEELLAHALVKNLILEKFLFTKSEDYTVVGKLIEEKKINAWVNCPRRMAEFYRNLQSELTGKIDMIVTGNDWGLGCNGIHALDLFSFLIKSTKISLTNNLIDKNVTESKRPGYIDFSGAIMGFGEGNVFSMLSGAGEATGFFISIKTPNAKYVIEEGHQATVKITKPGTNWNWEESTFEMPYQSQLTNILVDEILETGNCKLTTYKESAELHLLLLNNFIDFLRKNKNDNSINECLIT